jgi:hypothetical protein
MMMQLCCLLPYVWASHTLFALSRSYAPPLHLLLQSLFVGVLTPVCDVVWCAGLCSAEVQKQLAAQQKGKPNAPIEIKRKARRDGPHKPRWEDTRTLTPTY